MGYYGLLWVTMGYYQLLSVTISCCGQNSKSQSDIKKQDEIKSDLQKQAGDNYLDLEKEVSLIGKQNKTLSLITRLNWDDKAMKKDSNLIKGFVFKKSNKDVSVFEIDSKKTSNKTVVSDLLWAYIG